MSARQKYRAWLLYTEKLEKYGIEAVAWRAFERWELRQYWLDGLLSSWEVLLLYWHLDI